MLKYFSLFSSTKNDVKEKNLTPDCIFVLCSVRLISVSSFDMVNSWASSSKLSSFFCTSTLFVLEIIGEEGGDAVGDKHLFIKKSEINFKDDSVLYSDNVNFFLRCVMYCKHDVFHLGINNK